MRNDGGITPEQFDAESAGGLTPNDDARRQLAEALTHIDWQQVVMNGGPPCFHVELDGHFCLRAERWVGHELSDPHCYVDLLALFTLAREREAGLVKERDEWIASYKRLVANFNHQEWQIADLAREVEKLRAALEKTHALIRASGWRADCDHKRRSCEEIGCNGHFFRESERTIAEALVAPTPEAVEQWRRERELDSAAVAAAEYCWRFHLGTFRGFNWGTAQEKLEAYGKLRKGDRYA